MTTTPTPSTFLENVRRSGLIPEGRFQELEKQPLPGSSAEIAVLLVRQKLLTRYQAQQLLDGRRIGFFLGPYKILKPLGKGGMGSVFLAEHVVMQRKVAIKILPQKHAQNRLILERFYREARAAAALDHPNLVRAYDICKHEDLHCLVMEYVEGKDLDVVLREKGALSCPRVAACGIWTALGLQHAFEKGIVHRDIKPANLILTRAGLVKILDMGLARFFDKKADDLTAKHDQGAVVCTPDFVAPEVLIDPAVGDIRSDIYSLGCTLYTLLVGHPPFPGTTEEKLLAHQHREPPPVHALRSDVPAAMSRVISRMMAKKPESRYQTPNEVKEALLPWSPWLPTNRNHRWHAEDVSSLWSFASVSSDAVDTLPTVEDFDPTAHGKRPGSLPASPPTPTFRFVHGVNVVLLILAIVGWARVWMNQAATATPSSHASLPAIDVSPLPTVPRLDPTSPNFAAAPRSVHRLSVSDQPYFLAHYRGNAVVNFQGKGRLPEDWIIATSPSSALVEVAAEQAGDGRILAFRPTNERGEARLTCRPFILPADGEYLLRVEYLHAGDSELQFAIESPRCGTLVQLTPRSTGTNWQTIETSIHGSSELPVSLTMHWKFANSRSTCSLRNLELRLIGKLPTGTTLSRIDTTGVQAFVSRHRDQEIIQRSGGGSLPAIWNVLPNTSGGLGEVLAERINGSLSIGLRNRESKGRIELISSGMLLDVQPGKRYRIVTEYLTNGVTLPCVTLQPDESSGDRITWTLERTSAEWNRREMTWTATHSGKYRLALSNETPGAENSFFFRAIEVQHIQD